MVCLETPEPHIRVLWGAQCVTPSFAQPTSNDGKVLAFVRDIRLGLLPDMMVVHPEWLTPADVAVPPAADIEALLVRLVPRNPHLPLDTPITERVSVPWMSLTPLSLVHQLMVSPFLVPENAWHMMHSKSDAMGMTQSGGTGPKLVEGGNNRAPARHQKPHQLGPS